MPLELPEVPPLDVPEVPPLALPPSDPDVFPPEGPPDVPVDMPPDVPVDAPELLDAPPDVLELPCPLDMPDFAPIARSRAFSASLKHAAFAAPVWASHAVTAAR